MNPDAEPKRSVLVVDDHEEMREVLVMIMSLEGWEVVSAGNAREALHILQAREQTNLSPIDLLLTDNRMPNPRDGIKLIQDLQQFPFASKMKVVLMSATMEDLTDEDRAQFSVKRWEILLKPFAHNKITSLAEKLCPRPPDTKAA